MTTPDTTDHSLSNGSVSNGSVSNGSVSNGRALNDSVSNGSALNDGAPDEAPGGDAPQETEHSDVTPTDDGPAGSARTQRFYDEQGWTENNGRLVDLELFGTLEDGPIRRELHQVFGQRIHDAVAAAGSSIDLLECGCGGSPELSLLDLCATYTGVDFSKTGLEQARIGLQDTGVDHELHNADVCNLPFEDDRFDAAYSARMIFHIPDREAQAQAISEMLRVVKPGGVMVIITANPFPVLFPERTVKRLVALTPVLGSLANRLRSTPPLPYEPMSLPWFKRQIGDKGSIELISNGLPTTSFNRQVSEFSGLGRRLWLALRWIELTFPRASVWLGNYTQITVTKY